MKFNQKHQTLLNYEGAKAYRLSPELELYTLVVTASLEDKFYERSGDRIKRLRGLIGQVDPWFVAKLAIYARDKMNLRSIPLVLAVELAKVHSGDDIVKRIVSRIVQRPDEITELLAYYQAANERTGQKKLNKLSNQLRKGLATAFNKFDEYQFAKYDRKAEVRLRDALFLVHPKAKDEAQQALFDKIANQQLAIPDTWETRLSKAGQDAGKDPAKRKQHLKDQWECLIQEGKMGYMALLRNLRNFLQYGVSRDHLEIVAAKLSNRNAVLKSKQLPFRFLAAYRELATGIETDQSFFHKALRAILNVDGSNAKLLLDALEKAVLISAENIVGFSKQDRILIACDVSGSMYSPVSRKSSIRLYDIGLLLGMILQEKCARVETGIFGDRWKRIALPSGNVLSNVGALYKREGEVGYSTNGYLVIDDLIQRQQIVDRVMIFTDCQLWDSYNRNQISIADRWRQYKKVAPGAKLYLFDLAGYGQVPLRIVEGDVNLIAGWSGKIFEVLEAIEKGGNTLDQINQIEL